AGPRPVVLRADAGRGVAHHVRLKIARTPLFLGTLASILASGEYNRVLKVNLRGKEHGSMDQPRRTGTLSQPPPSLARCALSAIFFLNGVVLASWVPHIPAVKARHALGDGQLGLVLLSMAVGSVLALPLAGRLIGRFGSRRMTAVAALGFCLALPLPVVSPTVGLLVPSLMLLG